MKNSYISVARNTNFRSLWLGQITSQIALNMLYFVLALKVYQITRSNTAVSLLLLSFGVAAIIFGIIAGAIVDYFDNRTILNFCNLTRVFILILFFFFANNLFALYILSIIISIITQLFIPAEAPSIPIFVDKSHLLVANSLFTISFYLSTIFGFVLAGIMMKIFGQTNVFLVMILLMLFAFYFTFKLPKMKARSLDAAFTLNYNFIKNNIDEGLMFIKDHKRIGQSLIILTLSQALIACISVLAPGFADKVLTIDLYDASIFVMGPAALGLVTGAFWVGRASLKFLKGSIILSGILATGATLMLLSLINSAQLLFLFNILDNILVRSSLVIVSILLALLGFFNAFMSVPANTILQEESRSNIRGRVYGVLSALIGGVSLIPVVFSGILADIFGVSLALFIIGAIIVSIGMYKLIRR